MKFIQQNKKLTALTLILSAVIALCPVSVPASEQTGDGKEVSLAQVESSMDEILEREISSCGEKSLQGWLDGYASQNPTDGNVETFLLGMVGADCQGIDYTSYQSALEEELVNTYESANPSSLQKGILVLAGLQNQNETDPDFETLVSYAKNETIGAKGTMSFVYGLFVLFNTGNQDAVTDEMIASCLDYQSEDGGFSLDGSAGDVDVTAMMLQALSLAEDYDFADRDMNAAADTRLEAAIDAGLDFLAEEQQTSGGYLNMGQETSESSDQVLMAYTGFDMDASEFYPVILAYQTEDGGISHIADGETNEMASAEAYMAFSALRRQLLGESFLLDFTAYSEDDVSYIIESKGQSRGIGQAWTWLISDYRRAGSALLLLGWLIIVLTQAIPLFAAKKKTKTKKQLLGITLIFAVVTALLWLIHIEGKEEYRTADTGVIADADDQEAIEVTFSISAETVGDGILLPEKTYFVKEGTNVFELLSEVCREEDIQFEYTGSQSGYTYIQGIDYIYELDHGELSGWMYCVNGEFPDKGCNSFILSEGDQVEWLYTTDIGKDLADD